MRSRRVTHDERNGQIEPRRCRDSSVVGAETAHDAGVDKAHTAEMLSMGYDGTDVVVGVIDYGIDLNHAAFTRWPLGAAVGGTQLVVFDRCTESACSSDLGGKLLVNVEVREQVWPPEDPP